MIKITNHVNIGKIMTTKVMNNCVLSSSSYQFKAISCKNSDFI